MKLWCSINHTLRHQHGCGSSASSSSETENCLGPIEAWLSVVQRGYSVESDERLLQMSHGVGTGRPCVALSDPRRGAVIQTDRQQGEESKERCQKYSSRSIACQPHPHARGERGDERCGSRPAHRPFERRDSRVSREFHVIHE